MTEFKGIIAPLITPFDSEERVDLDAIDRIVGRLRESGIDGLFVCGGTGEWWALTEEERIVIAERVMDYYVRLLEERDPLQRLRSM